MKKSYVVKGKVQGVMFRQTVIRAAQKRSLQAGATNLASGNEVSVSLIGEDAGINEIISGLEKGEPINSWQALPESVSLLDEFIELSEHQVTMENVDSFNWSGGVEFYL